MNFKCFIKASDEYCNYPDTVPAPVIKNRNKRIDIIGESIWRK